MSKEKSRLDTLIFKKGLVESREKAKALIMEGKVYCGSQRMDKPGTIVPEEILIEIRGEKLGFVSRGGLKLAKAVEVFGLDFNDKVVADIGASTGGFTDCALQNGAARVYAIDVGYGQLDWKLRSDPRVVCMERTNARYLHQDHFPEKVDWVVCDVAFISVIKLFPAIEAILKENGQALLLIKPQFEAGPEKVGKKGVVKDPVVQREVIEKVLGEAEQRGFNLLGIEYSPIRGPEGNIEFLAWLTRGTFEQNSPGNWLETIEGLVNQAWIETE
ncbi:hemolysin A [Syntrophobotulus glycolicus DSM 8271]|uniref:Hemolysin A n=1 Tax=Syntrophobotulus glycolicus (strain DSM 8271 / FlGlyR) TaxID=645991 RepID=F0T095_SYNGF|nr:TlyA family RNA methyltransferase [Syntrophobotulus glycolicus]ADY56182.1 hemolysin A [Syntrophobotulus glycolicus DSM 8271]